MPKRTLVRPTALDQLRRRHDDAFLEDVRRVRADRARTQTANIREVRPAHDESAAPAVVEHRSEQGPGH